jgi:hypothetical protein
VEEYGCVDGKKILRRTCADVVGGLSIGYSSEEVVLIRAYGLTRVQVDSLRTAAPTARPPPCSSLHCFESARWQHLKRGLEQFPRGPLVKADPQGRCAAALLFEDQLLVMKATAVGSSRPSWPCL